MLKNLLFKLIKQAMLKRLLEYEFVVRLKFVGIHLLKQITLSVNQHMFSNQFKTYFLILSTKLKRFLYYCCK